MPATPSHHTLVGSRPLCCKVRLTCLLWARIKFQYCGIPRVYIAPNCKDDKSILCSLPASCTCVHLEGSISSSCFLLADHPPQYMHTFIVSEPCPASPAASQDVEDFLVVILDSYVYCNVYSAIACVLSKDLHGEMGPRLCTPNDAERFK